jgi:hypothetical protein
VRGFAGGGVTVESIQSIVSLAISIVTVPVWVTIMANMGEVARWAGDLFRAVLGLIIMLIPGTVFWLVVIGIVVIVERWNTGQAVLDSTGQYPREPEGNHVEGWEHNAT